MLSLCPDVFVQEEVVGCQTRAEAGGRLGWVGWCVHACLVACLFVSFAEVRIGAGGKMESWRKRGEMSKPLRDARGKVAWVAQGREW